jgi:hypothetical protein
LDLGRLEAALEVIIEGELLPGQQVGGPRQMADTQKGVKLATYMNWFRPITGIDRGTAFWSLLNDWPDIMIVAQFRLGSHSLFVESMRWKRPHVPRSQRICRCCSLGQVEDELHVAVECPAYNMLRDNFMRAVETGRDLSVTSPNIMISLMDCVNQDQWKALAEYLRRCYALRANTLIDMGLV